MDHHNCDHHHHSHSPTGHQHDHKHGTHGGPLHHHSTINNLKIALLLNLSFALIELAGGVWTGSLAIVTDAIHDFGDASALGLAVLFEYLASRRATQTFTYGYRRLSLVSAAVTSGLLVVGAVFMIIKSMERLQDPKLPYLPGMLGLALLGVVVNGYAAWRLMRGSTMNEKAVSWHLLEDVFGWVAVFVGTLLMMVFKIPQIDAYLSLFFSLFIVLSVSKQFFKTLRLFLQGTPENFDYAKMNHALLKVNGVKKIHDVHLWSLDGVSHVLTIHVVVEPTLEIRACIDLKNRIRECLHSFGNIHATIEIEWDDEVCSLIGQNCHQSNPGEQI